MTNSVILTGAPGSGKSSVLEALSTMLEIDRVTFGALETEQFARGWPWLDASVWIPQLAAVVSLQRSAGRDAFIVVATTETEDELIAVADAIGGRPAAVCLSAAADVVADRVAVREPDSWPGKAALVEHARRLADEIPRIHGLDLVLSTEGRDAATVAMELRQWLAARGMFTS